MALFRPADIERLTGRYFKSFFCSHLGTCSSRCCFFSYQPAFVLSVVSAASLNKNLFFSKCVFLSDDYR